MVYTIKWVIGTPRPGGPRVCGRRRGRCPGGARSGSPRQGTPPTSGSRGTQGGGQATAPRRHCCAHAKGCGVVDGKTLPIHAWTVGIVPSIF
eukprot:695624-Pyramimonas_sp.AAC.4